MKFLFTSAVVAIALSFFSVSAEAALVLDQEGGTVANGGLGAPVIQSFTPADDNIAAVDVLVSGTAAFENDLTVNVYSDYASGSLSGLLATGFVDDVGRGTTARATWTPVPIAPEEIHYLEFVLSQDAGERGLVIGVLTGDPYDRGAVLEGGGNLHGGTVDAVFKTYSDSGFTAIPAPAALPAGLLGLAALAARRGRRRA